MNFSVRIKLIVDTLFAGNKSEFSRITDIPEANVRSYLSGTLPKADTLEKIVKTCDISYEWLLAGSGPMLREEASKQTELHGDVIEQEGIVNMGKGNVIGCDAIRIKMLEEKCAEQAQQIEDLKKDKELLSQLVKGMMTK